MYIRYAIRSNAEPMYESSPDDAETQPGSVNCTPPIPLSSLPLPYPSLPYPSHTPLFRTPPIPLPYPSDLVVRAFLGKSKGRDGKTAWLGRTYYPEDMQKLIQAVMQAVS